MRTSKKHDLAQTIHGNIYDAYSKEPLVNAIINANNFSRVAISDSEGYFKMDNLSIEQDAIQIEKPGYETYKEVASHSDDTLYLELKLFPISISLNNEVVVTAQRHDINQLDVPETVSILEQRKIEEYAGGSVPN